MLFMTVDRQDITLPVADWFDNSSLWGLFEEAKAGKSANILFDISGKSGRHYQDILKVVNRCNLDALDFLALDLLEKNGTGATLQSRDLLAPIRSLYIVIEELHKAVDSLWCMSNRRENSANLLEAFENSKIDNDVDLDYYETEGLFVILKALLWAMTDALTNNKVFLYVQWTA